MSVLLHNDGRGRFDSRIIVPLMPPEEAPAPHKRLNPTFIVDDRPYVMVTQFMIALGVAGNLDFPGDYDNLIKGTTAWPLPARNHPAAIDDT